MILAGTNLLKITIRLVATDSYGVSTPKENMIAGTLVTLAPGTRWPS